MFFSVDVSGAVFGVKAQACCMEYANTKRQAPAMRNGLMISTLQEGRN
jgi:hypothetical protein